MNSDLLGLAEESSGSVAQIGRWRSRGLVLGQFVCLGALSAAGPVLRVWNDGPLQRAGALRLGLATIVWAGVVGQIARGSRWARVLAPVALVAAALVAAPRLGRAPVIVALSLVVVGTARRRLAMRSVTRAGWPADHTPSDREPGRSVWWVSLGLCAVVWWWSAWWPGEIAVAVLPTALFVLAGTVLKASAVSIARRTRHLLASAALRVSSWSRVLSGLAQRFSPQLERWSGPALSLISALISVPIFYRLAADKNATVQGLNDLWGHNIIAQHLSIWPPSPGIPHFLFHLLTHLLAGPFGIIGGSVTVLSIAVGISTYIIYLMARGVFSEHSGLSVMASCAVVVGVAFSEAPNAALDRLWRDGPPVYLPLHLWSNPTSIVLAPFALSFTALAISSLNGGLDRRRRNLCLLVLLLLGMLAKPNFALAVLPAMVVEVVRVHGFNLKSARWLGILSVPACGLLLWQWNYAHVVGQFHYGDGVLIHNPATFRVQIAPLSFLRGVGADRLRAWYLLWPIVLAAAVGRRRYLRAYGIRLSLMTVAFAAIPAVLLTETGPTGGGDFVWGLIVTCQVLYVFTIIYLVGEVVRAWNATRTWARLPKWVWVFGALSALSLAAGAVSVLTASGIVHPLPATYWFH